MFDGETIEHENEARLQTLLERVYRIMSDGHWRTLGELARIAYGSEAGVSARLRDLRKPKFQALYPCTAVERRRRAASVGVWEYRVVRSEGGEHAACQSNSTSI